MCVCVLAPLQQGRDWSAHSCSSLMCVCVDVCVFALQECCKAFSLFTNDPHITHITAEHLKRVAQMAGEDLNADRIQVRRHVLVTFLFKRM